MAPTAKEVDPPTGGDGAADDADGVDNANGVNDNDEHISDASPAAAADDDKSDKGDEEMGEPLDEASVTVDDASVAGSEKNGAEGGGDAANANAAAAAAAAGEPETADAEAEGGERSMEEDDAAKDGGKDREPVTVHKPSGEGGEAGEMERDAVALAAAGAEKASEKDKEDDDEPLSPPAWSDVAYDKLVKYPKSSLQAQSYFDLQQIRAIKPVTLICMGIGVRKFPDVEDDAIINLAVARTKFQLYHPTDVMTSKRAAKPFLQKEVLRRGILHNLNALETLETLGPDPCHDDIPRGNMERKTDKMKSGIPAHLPRPGSYTLQQCTEWLRLNPPPNEEHAFLLESVKAWRRQVRDQIGNIDPRTATIEAAIRKYDREVEEHESESSSESEEEDEPRTSSERVSAAASAADKRNPTKDGMMTGRRPKPAANGMNQAFAMYQNQPFQLSQPPGGGGPPPHSFSFNPTQPQMAQPPVPSPRNFVPYNSQLATAVNMNNIQAQAITQYQHHLAALQSQLVAASNKTQFEIRVEKDTFKFNASHFVAYPGFRERLHGHSYKCAVKLIGSHQIGRDGYVLDFGCVKSVVKEVCKEMNEYFLVPTLSEVLKITVVDDEGEGICGECDVDDDGLLVKTTRKRKRKKYPGSVTIECEDGSNFVFPRQDCLLLPIMHSTAEELAVYLYGKILEKLDADYLHKRGVQVMEITVSEAVGQDATFRKEIPSSEDDAFDVAKYVSMEAVPPMPCGTDTVAATGGKRRKS